MSEDKPICVLDASALLAWLQREPGADKVEHALLADRCLLSAVNFSEVIAKLADYGVEAGPQLAASLESIGVEIVPFSQEHGWLAGALRQQTRVAGLSLGDRACIALAQAQQATVLTTDKAWLSLGLPLVCVDIRQ